MYSNPSNKGEPKNNTEIRPMFMWWKLISTWIVFLLLHYSYETFPNTLFKIIGEQGETNFFHMKMLFFAYIFTSIAEYVINRKKIASLDNFVYTRLVVAVAYPWLTITMFFIPQVISGDMLGMPWEIVFANVVTLIGVYLALRLEEAMASIKYRPALKATIWLVFLSALASYVAFSFNVPEHFFETPEGGH